MKKRKFTFFFLNLNNKTKLANYDIGDFCLKQKKKFVDFNY